MASQPYDIDNNNSSLRAVNLTPQLFTGIFVNILSLHFYSQRNILEPSLREYIWSPDPKTSKILIVPVWQWVTITNQQRPAIIVKRNSWQMQQTALGDGDNLIVDTVDANKLPIASTSTLQVVVQGSHTLFVLSTLPAQVELLASEVATRIMSYQQAIANEFGLLKCRVTEVGEPAKLEEATEYFAIPITIGYSFMNVWSLHSEAPMLRRITIETQ